MDHVKFNLSGAEVYIHDGELPMLPERPFTQHDQPSDNPESEGKIRVRRCKELGVTITTRVLDSGGAMTEIPMSLAWNPPRILYGANSTVITTNRELALAHARLHALLSIELGESIVDRLVPGYSPDCRVFIQTVEIPVQLKDNGRKLLDRISQVAHPSIRKKAFHVKGQSIKLPGTKVSFQIYDKSLESGSGCLDDHDKIVRYEVKLHRDKFAKYFPSNVKEGERVLAFDVDSLYEAFRNFTKELTGYFKVSGQTSVSKPAAFIVEVHRQFGLAIEALIDLYRISSGNTEETMRGVVRGVRSHMEQQVILETFDDLFPPQLPCAAGVTGKKQVEAREKLGQSVSKWNLPMTPSDELIEFFSSVQTFPVPPTLSRKS